MIFIYILMIVTAIVITLSFVLPIIQTKKSNLITEGTIISIRIEKRKINDYGGYTTFYFPTFKFTVDGQEYIKESFSTVTENIYKEGQQIKIAYYKENPMDAIILTDKKNKIVMGIGGIIFVILTGLSVLINSLILTKASYMSTNFPRYLLLILGFIVLMICYIISKK